MLYIRPASTTKGWMNNRPVSSAIWPQRKQYKITLYKEPESPYSEEVGSNKQVDFDPCLILTGVTFVRLHDALNLHHISNVSNEMYVTKQTKQTATMNVHYLITTVTFLAYE